MNDEEFGSFEFLNLKYRRKDQIIYDNLRKCKKTEKITPESCRMH